MNNILTLSQLITRLSKVTGTDTGTARRFLRTLFATIEETLAAGESVEIKGIGTFHRSTDPAFGAPGGVAFIPDAALAAEINSPFAMFEAVELADGVEFEEPETPMETPAPEAEPEPAAEPEITVEPAPEPPVAEEPAVVVAPAVEAEPVEETEPAAETVEVHTDAATSITYKWPEEEEEAAEAEANEPAPTDLSDETDESDNDDTETEENKGSRLWLWIIIGILAGAGIGLAAAFLATPRPDFDYTEETELTEEPAPAAIQKTETPVIEEIEVQDAVISPEETPAAPAAVSETAEVTAPEPQAVAPAPTKKTDKKPEPRYDTVTKSRYLATMAREYYGRGIFWVFIYEANADHLDNPDRIRPGTRVIIPDRSTFPADLNEAQRLAEKKQAEIRKKFGK